MTANVLIARLDSVGDVLLAGPAVRAVADAARVTMLCSSAGAPAARLLPGVDELVVWEAPWITIPPRDVTHEDTDAFVQRIRALAVDEAVILTSFHQSPLPLALLLRLAGVARITGASVDYPGSLLDVRLRPGEDLPEAIPESERALAIAAAAGFPSRDDGRLSVLPPPAVADLTGAEPYVVLHPGAQASARCWPIERFCETAPLLTTAGFRVVATGALDEAPLTARIVASTENAIDLAGRCTLAELAGVIAGAEAIVCGNTGPAHLAAAVGTPVVSLFSPVVPAVKWAPYGVPRRILGDQSAECRGSRARECPIPGHPCLTEVRASDAFDAVLDLTSTARLGESPRPCVKGASR